MKTLVSGTNIVQIATDYFNKNEEFQNYLNNGDLRNAERLLLRSMFELLTLLTCNLLNIWVASNLARLTSRYGQQGYGRFETRPLCLQIQTGAYVQINGPYARRFDGTEVEKGHRHLFNRHFSVIGHASPEHASKTVLCGLLSPSYDIGNELLMELGVSQSPTRVRTLANEMAGYCFNKEAVLALGPGESLKGKRVVIGIDGGRCNTRENRGERNAGGNLTYATAWCEPKLFVIQTLDENGALSKDRLPIYSGRFSDKDMWQLLKEYLVALHIEQAECVQVLADGAPWIWNTVSELLTQLGVPKERTVLSLDYFHGSSYVHKLVEEIPKNKKGIDKESVLALFKNWLWTGQSSQIVGYCKTIFKRPSDEVKRWMNYLEKHEDKTQYADYEKNKLMCGSGIIESGIRRVINLRFKNAGTFWQKETVEKLIFLRATFLAKRWNILMDNIVMFEF